jgi:short-subunit dehydrogenase involved in D-alanine esterification of teichoic acids
MKLNNKKILITGATSGIGLSLVEKLYQNNHIYIIARNAHKIKALQSRFPDVVAYQADFNDLIALQKVIKAINHDTQTLDLLVNNAAVQYTPMFTDSDFSIKSIADEITTNFTSICYLCYLLLPLLNQQHSAVILNVNSGLAIAPKTTSAIYCASKSALNSFSQSLRYQLNNTHVQVLQAFLPLVDTAMTEGRGSSKMSVDKVSDAIIYGIEQRIIDHDIGKVKLLRFINRLFPNLSKKIMRDN